MESTCELDGWLAVPMQSKFQDCIVAHCIHDSSSSHGVMDSALDFGSKGCRFKSGWELISFAFPLFYFVKVSMLYSSRRAGHVTS